mmetsp:Transcript_20579/g.38975  ORF Transcript_20579/g.38975 Transcript_20579/m.38975 type:complete len:101 (-) Transcript_20579:206-508(-)
MEGISSNTITSLFDVKNSTPKTAKAVTGTKNNTAKISSFDLFVLVEFILSASITSMSSTKVATVTDKGSTGEAVVPSTIDENLRTIPDKRIGGKTEFPTF